ncbi:GGDEF domain-containing protein [Hyphomicrobium nitrativorans]|uniref:GGDEF domain-containing protein n=1 Tax=Hyphomicrobium nitrativorans TaxID=1427356 RepID=UPI0009DE45E4|nr:diguanylate cyclase [Hyphomicrobium nitrativorans]
MNSSPDLSRSQQGILAVGAGVLGAAIVALLAISDFDLTPIRTLRSVHVGGGGTIISTQYNPFAILAIALVGLAIVGAFAWLIARFAPLLASASFASIGGTSSAVARAGQRIERELSKVLELIRGHISSNESYAKSLANAQSRLSELSEGEQVRVIVSLLVAENERMRRDSSELKVKLEESQRQIETLRSNLIEAEEVVLRDPLTGVGNRRCFDIEIEKAIADSRDSGAPLSLVMCDIDHFKRVNDDFGHQVGDEIIKMFSRVIEASVRDGDTVIRYGGEEFAIILPKAGQDVAKSIAERIRRQFESKKLTVRETNQKIGQMTASFGVAEYRSGDDTELLVQRADTKLYDAKSGGRNQVSTYGDN